MGRVWKGFKCCAVTRVARRVGGKEDSVNVRVSHGILAQDIVRVFASFCEEGEGVGLYGGIDCHHTLSMSLLLNCTHLPNSESYGRHCL